MGLVRIESTRSYIYLYKPNSEWYSGWQWVASLYSQGGLRYKVLLRILNEGKSRILELGRYIVLDMPPDEEELLFALADISLKKKRVRDILIGYIEGVDNAKDTLAALRPYTIAASLERRRR